MSGHGWVTPNADGSKARCGGPAMCAVCALEFARLHVKEVHDFPERLTLRDTKVTADEGQRIYSTATGYGYEKCDYVRADIASTATELLAALKHCVIERSEWLDEARAAIAKAEGRP